MSVTHIAGNDVTIDGKDGHFLRQRCGWCGAKLIDLNLTLVAVPVDQPGPPATWPVGSLVTIDGVASVAMGNVDVLPDDACARNPLTYPGVD